MARRSRHFVAGEGANPPLRQSSAIPLLGSIIAILAIVAAGVGLFLQTDGKAFDFPTLRGESARMYGQGLYRLDTLFGGAGNHGTDAATLFFGIPFLAVATILYRRGSLRGGLLLTGALGYFLYVYSTYSFSVAYNALFLVYVALFSASLFAFIIAFNAIDLDALPDQVLSRLPRRGPGIYLIVAGLLTSLIWLEAPISTILGGRVPAHLDSYTTLVTYALDLGVIVPSCLIGGVKILRRDTLGYRIALPLLSLIVMLVPGIIAQTVYQLSAGVTLSPGEIVGPVSGFLTLGLVAIVMLARILRAVPDRGDSGR
jgi:hypothetical protein